MFFYIFGGISSILSLIGGIIAFVCLRVLLFCKSLKLSAAKYNPIEV